MNIVHLGDCMAGMTDKPDGYYDLAVVDPVFGELVTKGGYMNNNSSSMAKNNNYNNNLWKQPKTNIDYFKELFRVSKNQVIWGGNYFIEDIKKNSSCWLVWNKLNGDNHFADCEMAWTNFETATRMFTFKWQGMLQGNMKDKETRIHPTQKPVALYDWIFKNYAKPGMKILDTHVGSGSSRIAADKAGLWFEGWELDADYHAAQEKRYKLFKSQLRLAL